MPSPSRSAKRSSTSAPGAQEALREQEAFLEALGESIAAIAALRDEAEILDRLCVEARRLFAASSARFASGGEARGAGALPLPLVVRGEQIGVLELEREGSFARLDVIRARMLADFGARAVESARLLAESQALTEQLITAEQDERRRLSILLHDGPLQSMSGIALMHDAALAALADGRHEDAARVVEASLERERETIRALRDLTFAIEPLVLRDHGFAAAVDALREQIERSSRITVSASVEPAERIAEKAQVALYQLVREALTQAVRRRPGRIRVTVSEQPEGGLVAEIADDGGPERRSASIQAIEERASVLKGRLAVEPAAGGGTVVQVTLPAYVAR